jgi:5-formyltetrahydrofolate cyclo-ligase
MQEKIVIRKKALLKRKKNYFEINSQFFNPLINFFKKNKYKREHFISLYYPSNYEVNVLSIFKLIKKINIKTLLPVTKPNNQMNFVEWKYLDPLKVNKFGMLEPSLKKVAIVHDTIL